MIRRLLPPLLATAALAGCVTPREGRLPEFVGRPLAVQAANGQVTTLMLFPDGRVEARFDGKTRAAHWDFADGNLCYRWTETYRECWRHTQPFRSGRTETIRSDHGHVVKVTMR
jgi:hypothetical protein